VAICHRIVDTGGKFVAGIVDPASTGVVDTGGKFAAGVIDTGSNFAAGVVDTGSKFATGVVDTGGAPLMCEYLREFFEKIRNGPNGILWGWGETDS
jgi:hypothetical protein